MPWNVQGSVLRTENSKLSVSMEINKNDESIWKSPYLLNICYSILTAVQMFTKDMDWDFNLAYCLIHEKYNYLLVK